MSLDRVEPFTLNPFVERCSWPPAIASIWRHRARVIAKTCPWFQDGRTLRVRRARRNGKSSRQCVGDFLRLQRRRCVAMRTSELAQNMAIAFALTRRVEFEAPRESIRAARPGGIQARRARPMPLDTQREGRACRRVLRPLRTIRRVPPAPDMTIPLRGMARYASYFDDRAAAATWRIVVPTRRRSLTCWSSLAPGACDVQAAARQIRRKKNGAGESR